MRVSPVIRLAVALRAAAQRWLVKDRSWRLMVLPEAASR